ncbi:hypothetical protein CH63R_03007 [Colletotrichum higginsianum IMI 349063]|uniref:Uncharacterized protein n=2 Tax=Colletotrichum higginsianum TaxID=80884 RepID=A0A1B7YQG8_COLHI|nr:hypothetical protein CH63R_03007 [Colletotrichum higginsianum IMI 349063]OBR14281.1 hypothetical protein CH63R_03007 [Colletotrichum higginsianum IMI 349063]TID02235.1 hypothetical protein CH35J_004413 [Colletotrichum higginsianum]
MSESSREAHNTEASGSNNDDSDGLSSKKRKATKKLGRPPKRAKKDDSTSTNTKTRKRTAKGIWEQMDNLWTENDIPSAVRDFLNKMYPLKTLRQLDEIIPKNVTYDEDWSAQDEQNLQAA